MIQRTWFKIRLWRTPPQYTGFALQQRDGAYLSAHGRMAAARNGAVFPSAELAGRCVELWLPRLKARWGEATCTEIEQWHGRKSADPLADASMLIARARAGRFTSNQPMPDELVQAVLAELITQQPHYAVG